jgi:uncharacterized membrane protein
MEVQASLSGNRTREEGSMEIGPIQLVAVGFERPEFKGEILRELQELRSHGDLRLIDALVVAKDQDGNVVALEASDLSLDERIELGAVIGGLIGLGAAGEKGMEAGALAGAMLVADEYEYGMDLEAVASVADDIPEGGAALLLLIEHRWALGLKRAIRGAGGVLIAQDMLNPEALVGVGKALAEASEG